MLRDAWLVDKDFKGPKAQGMLAQKQLRSEEEIFGNELKWDPFESGTERDGLPYTDFEEEVDEDEDEDEEDGEDEDEE